MTCYNCRACMSGRIAYACSAFSKAIQYISYNSALVENTKSMSFQQHEVKKQHYRLDMRFRVFLRISRAFL